MADPAWELQKSIHAALVADSAIVSLLGGGRVYDDVPRDAAFPYLTFGQSTVRDWSTGSEDGTEHVVTLHVWSRAAGEKEVHEIMGAARAALHEAGLAVAGSQLINLRHEFSEAARDADGEHYHGLLRYRAVLEPA